MERAAHVYITPSMTTPPPRTPTACPTVPVYRGWDSGTGRKAPNRRAAFLSRQEVTFLILVNDLTPFPLILDTPGTDSYVSRALAAR